ncbi:MAG TPA: UDP-2,3-diacylglucosamine diphosphatase, partial [Saprospiraceae bacterium]|nr:UDP-2,3-diacylglucosamine diphosphatase [Saprospiraceae bacterium]
MQNKKTLEIAVLSDIHLGTFGCRAKEVLKYLRSIDPEILILNGDFLDGWQFKKSYFPREHTLVINEILRKAISGTKVYYLAGNHDDFLRKFTAFSTGNICIKEHLVLQLNGKRYWFFHGDIFDASVLISPSLAKLGGMGYDLLIRINRLVDKFREGVGKERMSFAGRVKQSVKKAVKFIDDFEKKAVHLGAQKGYDFVVCGHIHMPVIKKFNIGEKEVTYMNSGDWVENLSALEFNGQEWRLEYFTEKVNAKQMREV